MRTLKDELEALVRWYRLLPDKGGELTLREGVLSFAECADGCCTRSIDIEMVVEAIEEDLKDGD
jgi:hypothetical protein